LPTGLVAMAVRRNFRRQTSGPPTLDTTLRSMNSRSTVAWSADRDVVNECIDTPPTSPVQKGRDAVELEHIRRRATDFATRISLFRSEGLSRVGFFGRGGIAVSPLSTAMGLGSAVQALLVGSGAIRSPGRQDFLVHIGFFR